MTKGVYCGVHSLSAARCYSVECLQEALTDQCAYSIFIFFHEKLGPRLHPPGLFCRQQRMKLTLLCSLPS
jgi:hypothetical protein